MAVNTSRSQNVDLDEGLTDGKYQKTDIDRGGQVDPATRRARQSLHNGQGGYNRQESFDKVRPDGLRSLV